MTPKSYIDIFSDVQRNYKDYFNMLRLDPIYKVFYSDKSNYCFYSDTNKMISELEKMQTGLSLNFIKFLDKSYKKYIVTQNNILDKPMINKNELINPNLLRAMNIFTSTNTYTNKIIKNDKLRDYLVFTSMYIGINPYSNSNIYTLIPTISHLYGLWYIEGGFYKYIQSLERLFLELGGKIIKNCEVTKIIVDSDKVKKIKTKNKTFDCDLAICNADYPYVCENLLEDKYCDYKKENLPSLDYSCSVFMLYLGLDKVFDNLEVHNIYISKNFRKGIESAFRGYLSSDLSFYIYYPCIIDKTFCQNGHSSMNIMVRVPNLSFKNITYNKEEVDLIKRCIFNNLKNIKELKDIKSHIIYEKILTPNDLKNKFNLYFGSAFGLSHKLSQSGYFRPHIKSNKVSGLYFLSSSTHPGNGASVVIDGSKVLCDIIEHENRC